MCSKMSGRHVQVLFANEQARGGCVHNLIEGCHLHTDAYYTMCTVHTYVCTHQPTLLASHRMQYNI